MSERDNIILIVEDEVLIALMEKKQLESENYKVLYTNTGEKAIDLVCAKREPVDLILMDIDLGNGMDGTETARQILKCADVPILFLSSHTEKEIVAKTESITNYGYVVKNSSFTVLYASIKMAFKLFSATKRINEERMNNEAAYEEMQVINDNLLKTQSELIETENSLRHSEEKYRYIDDSSLDSIYSYDRQGRFTHANRALCRLLSLPNEKIIGKTHEQLGFPKEQCEEWAKLHRRVIDTNSTVIAVTEAPIPGSQSVYFEVVLNPIHDEADEIIGISGTTRDITKRRQAEEQISTAKNLLSSILESSPEVIVFALDRQYRYLAFNSKHKEAMQHIWGKEIAIGMNMLEVIGHHEDSKKAKENFDRALAGESFVLVEDYGDDKFSRQSWLDYWSPIKNENELIMGLTCFVINNTEQKIAEKKIGALLEEKEILLKEVHHRIKNNMNTVNSLLSLQASSISDPNAIRALEDAGSRIYSMSLLYDKLYRSADFNELSIKEYLASLADDIIANFHNSKSVEIRKELQDFMLDSKHLQPLGIIINELLTNSMKYAFTDRDAGLITISASNTGGHISISVQDDGNGIPESVSFENPTGFGLQLVHALTQQLNGTVRIERGNGAKVVLEFKL